jgi:hypothetical protein
MGFYIPAPEGDSSPGVAPGGLENQILRKASDLNYDTEWVDPEVGNGTQGPAGSGWVLPGLRVLVPSTYTPKCQLLPPGRSTTTWVISQL